MTFRIGDRVRSAARRDRKGYARKHVPVGSRVISVEDTPHEDAKKKHPHLLTLEAPNKRKIPHKVSGYFLTKRGVSQDVVA